VEPADDIRKRGFKKWYERQLIESHAYLVTCFLCMILVAAMLEELNFRAPGVKLALSLAWIAAGGAIGLFSWLRYRSLMVAAEKLGDRSVCEQCHAYAKFDIVESGGSRATPEGALDPWLKVRCRKCGHGWTMP
jgi:ribosomal protein L40E